jgi:hypothetical protein
MGGDDALRATSGLSMLTTLSPPSAPHPAHTYRREGHRSARSRTKSGYDRLGALDLERRDQRVGCLHPVDARPPRWGGLVAFLARSIAWGVKVPTAATRNDVRPDTQSRPVSDAHYLRL